MTCDDARELCSALVDEALMPDERAALDAHLAGCADCRRELERLRATVSLLRAAPPARAPAGFVDRVLEAARPVPWYRRVASRLFRPLSVKLPVQAAALILISVAAVYVFQHTPALQQAARQESAPRSEPPRQMPDARSRPPDPGPAPGSAREADPPASAVKRPDATAPAEKPVPQREAEQVGANVPDAAPPARPPAPRSPDAESARDRVATADAPEELKKSRAPAEPGAIMRSAPAEGRLGGGARERQDQSPPPGAKAESPAQARLASRPPDVLARLAADDRDLAERTLAGILARFGGAELSRRVEAGATVIDVTVPREGYTEIARELDRLGRFTIDRVPATLPAEVVLTLRLMP
ncbi:MAG TPA: zf-HC2 domain-containing protein [Candidatus Limnocylindrales bacterium]|nr:zf-HC2 domain-containing protein [Candidatus Limnocylindrales bacterium]